MQTSLVLRKGVHRVGVRHPHSLPVPCAQRWHLRLAKARIWGEMIDEHASGAWQLEDDRHMSPEFTTFMGRNMRGMKPGLDDVTRPNSLLEMPLPHNSHVELSARRDIPHAADNFYMGRKLHDTHVHGMYLPGLYRVKKDLNKATRNDKKISKKNKGLHFGGWKSPPSGFEPIPDSEEEDD